MDQPRMGGARGWAEPQIWRATSPPGRDGLTSCSVAAVAGQGDGTAARAQGADPRTQCAHRSKASAWCPGTGSWGAEGTGVAGSVRTPSAVQTSALAWAAWDGTASIQARLTVGSKAKASTATRATQVRIRRRQRKVVTVR